MNDDNVLKNRLLLLLLLHRGANNQKNRSKIDIVENIASSSGVREAKITRNREARRAKRNRLLLARSSRSRNSSKLRITHDYSDDLNASYRISFERGKPSLSPIYFLLSSPLGKEGEGRGAGGEQERHERTVDTRDGVW